MKIAIIGAGASGLAAIKSCLEYGFNPVCYEKTDYFGGLWKYKPDKCDGEASVMKNTVINTSKEIMAFSDFPPNKELPNFMHNTQVLQYFQSYAEKFHLLEHIEYGSQVDSIDRDNDFDKNGRWAVTVTKESDTRTHQFDAVLICTGHHVYPYIPSLTGIENFTGQVLHSHDYKDANEFAGKTVVIVGLGNSAGDIAVDVARVAKKTVISTRRGAWLWGRIEEGGYPRDISTRARFNQWLGQHLPTRLTLAMMEKQLIKKVDHETFGLQPDFRINQCHPLVNDELPYRLLTGQIVIKPDVASLNQTGAVFSDGSAVDSVDVVILATGYSFKFDNVEGGRLIHVRDNNVKLYKHMFPPNISNNTLAVIGLIQPLDREAMLRARYIHSRRHTIQVDYMDYMDMLADIIGCKPDLKRTLISDPKLALALFFGPAINYQYRLDGPHKWNGARHAILTVWDRVRYPLKSRATVPLNKDTKLLKIISSYTPYIIAIFLFLYLLLNMIN